MGLGGSLFLNTPSIGVVDESITPEGLVVTATPVDGYFLGYDSGNFYWTTPEGGKVKISSVDNMTDYLENKIIQGTNILIQKVSVAGKEHFIISASGTIGGSVAFIDVTDKPTTLSGYGITDGVNTSVTINGHALSANVTVTKTDLSLENVTNNAQVKKISSSTDNNIMRWDGTTGDTPQNSLVTIDDSGSVNIPSGQKYKINNTDLSYIDVGASASDHNHTSTYEPANANIQSHISSTLNPHSVTKAQVGLTNVTDNAQMKKIAESVDNQIIRFDGTTGDTPQGSLATINDSGSINIPLGQKYKINNVDLTYTDVNAAWSGHTHAGELYEPANPNIQAHISSTSNPHNITKAQLGLENVTNDAQMKKIAESVDNQIIRWDGTTGATPQGSLVTIDDLGSVNIPLGQTYQINSTPLTYTSVGAEPANANIQSHISSTSNPHNVTTTQLNLNNVTNNAQVKKISSSTDNNIMRWDGTTGDTPQNSLVTIDDSGSISIPLGQTYNINSTPLTYTSVGAEPANANIQSHISSTSNPHNVTKAQLGLTNVTDNAQVKKIAESVDNQVVRWDTTTGDAIQGSQVTINDSGSINIPSGQKYRINNVDLTYSDFGAEPANANIQSHISSTSNPHSTTKTHVGLGNVTDNAQVKKIAESVDNQVVRWDSTTGDAIQGTTGFTSDDSGNVTVNSLQTETVLNFKLVSATPTSPSSGYKKMYIWNDGNAYLLNSSGSQTSIGTGGGAGTSQVKISSTDTTEDYLENKLNVGVGLTLTKNNTGSNESITISNNDYDDISRQAIIDGNFEICQMNPVVATTVTNPATGTYPKFDMWKVEFAVDGGTNPTLVHSQNAVTMGDLVGGKYCMRIAPDGAGSSFGNGAYYKMSHYIFSGTRNLCGASRTVTLQVKLRSSIASKKIGVRLVQNYGTGGSPTADEILTGTVFSVTSSFATYSATFNTNTLVGKTYGTNNDDYLKVELYLMWGSDFNTSLDTSSVETFVGSGTIDFAQIQLNTGSTALPFLLQPWQRAFYDCQQWVEKGFPYGTLPADGTGFGVRFKTFETNLYTEFSPTYFVMPMVRVPVISFYNPAVSDANNKVRNYTDSTSHPAAYGNACNNSFYAVVNNSSIASGKLLVTTWVADCRF